MMPVPRIWKVAGRKSEPLVLKSMVRLLAIIYPRIQLTLSIDQEIKGIKFARDKRQRVQCKFQLTYILDVLYITPSYR